MLITIVMPVISEKKMLIVNVAYDRCNRYVRELWNRLLIKGRNFRDFCPFSRKFLRGKKLNREFAKVFFREKSTFSENRESFFQVLKSKNCKIMRAPRG